MSSLNTVTISGNLARDPEVKFLPSGTAVCEFTVAVSDWYKPKDGEGKELTYWIRCKAWGKTAERIGDMFQKGKPIALTGKLTQDEWTDAEGKKQSKTMVSVDPNGFIFCGGDRKAPANTSSGRPALPPTRPVADPDLDAPDDDIPF